MNHHKEDGRDNHNHEHENGANQAGGFFAGLLVGGLAGAGTMLLLAPQSGKRTRAKIQQKSIELREQTTDAVEDALAQTRAKARQINAGVHKQAEALGQRGQDVIDGQKEHWSSLVKAGKAAIQGQA